MTYHSRASWGARSPRGSRNQINAHPLGVAIHWNGPACAASIRTHDKCPGFIRGIQNFHMDGRGWSDIAYTMFACPHGELYEGRGKGVGTAANGTTSGNANYYAIYAMWGQGDGNVPDKMLDAIADGVALTRSWGTGNTVTTHNALFSTECPGGELSSLVKSGRFSGGPKPSSGSGSSSKPASSDYDRDDVRRFQRFHNLDDDGLWGDQTEKQAQAIRRCLKPGLKRGRWDLVRYWRLRLSRKPRSERTSKEMRKGIQWALNVKADGYWGDDTDRAWLALRDQHKQS